MHTNLFLGRQQIGILVILAFSLIFGGCNRPSKNSSAPLSAKAMPVSAVSLQASEWPVSLAVSGNVVPWQEIKIGAELAGLQITSVKVDVGSLVSKGDILVELANDVARATVAQQTAAVADAKASLILAEVTLERGAPLLISEAISNQDFSQYKAQVASAKARYELALANLELAKINLAKTVIRAPSNGVITLKSGNVGDLTTVGAPLFVMIRDNKLEWRAEVPAKSVHELKHKKYSATINSPDNSTVSGIVYNVAPTVDQVKNGVAYVTLPLNSSLKAGMFVSGTINLTPKLARFLPSEAVFYRDGFSYVMVIGPDSKVNQTKVLVGRKFDMFFEILKGLNPEDLVVKQGGGFLNTGDFVKIN